MNTGMASMKLQKDRMKEKCAGSGEIWIENGSKMCDESVQKMGETADFRELQSLLISILGSDAPDFSDLVSLVKSGNFEKLGEMAGKQILQWVMGEGLQWQEMGGILILVILLAFMKSMGEAFENSSISLFSGVVIHLLLIARLISLFQSFQSLTIDYLQNSLKFLNALFPVLTVTAAAGGSGLTAAGFYLSSISVSSLIQRAAIYFMIPFTGVFLVASLLDSIMEEPVFKGVVELIQKAVGFLLKSCMISATGLQVLQLMVLPKADSLKKQALLKTVSLIPGAGKAADSAATVLWGSSALLKSCIGAAGMLCILLIVFVPFFRLLWASFLYHLLLAVLSPVSDKKICRCLKAFAAGVENLVKIMFMSAMVSLILIAAAAW
ncbi:MAG: stage III sporulation protein AE [Lachnospiraceae bacterium]|nr:stage III sporulation protein AE [Lachnospiraceae bacterium]